MLDQRQSPDKNLLRGSYLDFGMLVNGSRCKTSVDDVDGNGWNGQQQLNASSLQSRSLINTYSGHCCRPVKPEGGVNFHGRKAPVGSFCVV
jgi:hypothetical protein